MQTLLHDLRYGFRMLRKNPGFTAVALLTLAIGIGVNTVIFTVVNAVLLRPLPFPDADHVLRLQERHDHFVNLTGATFQDVRETNRAFSAVAAYRIFAQNLSDLGRGTPPEEINTAFVSRDFLSVLQTAPVFGRGFSAAQFRQAAEGELLLSYGLWRHRFASDPEVIGKRIVLHGVPRVIVGVMPRGFAFPEQVQAWLPLTEKDAFVQNRRAHLYTTLARVKPGVSAAAVNSDLRAIAATIQNDNPGVDPGFVFRAQPLKENLVAGIRPALLLLLGAVGFVLLIACANVANLLLSRLVARQREIAVRAALGAGRVRLARQFLTESLLLSIGGGLLGCLGGIWGAKLLLVAYPGAVSTLDTPSLDLRVLLFVLAVSLLSAILFGVVPPLQFSAEQLHRQLAEGGRIAGSIGRRHLRSILVVGEVALAVVLLAGAGLLIRSLALLRQVDPGYDTSHLLVASATLNDAQYPGLENRLRFVDAVLERFRSLPGVHAAAAAGALPLRPVAHTDFDLEGHPYAPGEEPSAEVLTASPDYFEVMGIRPLAGRTFTARDVLGQPTAVVINQSMARLYWPDTSPLGKKIVMKDWGPDMPGQIVGVVSDVKVESLETPADPAVYYSLAQFPEGTLTTYLIVRSTIAPANLATALRHQVWAVDPQQPVSVFTMDQVISESLERRSFILTLLSTFAAVALFLAMVGIYGVVAQSVEQRTREFGIRLALGIHRQHLLLLVLKQELSTVALGLALGLVAALGLTRMLRGMLFEIRPADPITFSLLPALLAVVALLAAYIPARRATKVDPMRALRYE